MSRHSTTKSVDLSIVLMSKSLARLDINLAEYFLLVTLAADPKTRLLVLPDRAVSKILGLGHNKVSRLKTALMNLLILGEPAEYPYVRGKESVYRLLKRELWNPCSFGGMNLVELMKLRKEVFKASARLDSTDPYAVDPYQCVVMHRVGRAERAPRKAESTQMGLRGAYVPFAFRDVLDGLPVTDESGQAAPEHSEQAERGGRKHTLTAEDIENKIRTKRPYWSKTRERQLLTYYLRLNSLLKQTEVKTIDKENINSLMLPLASSNQDAVSSPFLVVRPSKSESQEVTTSFAPSNQPSTVTTNGLHLAPVPLCRVYKASEILSHGGKFMRELEARFRGIEPSQLSHAEATLYIHYTWNRTVARYPRLKRVAIDERMMAGRSYKPLWERIHEWVNEQDSDWFGSWTHCLYRIHTNRFLQGLTVDWSPTLGWVFGTKFVKACSETDQSDIEVYGRVIDVCIVGEEGPGWYAKYNTVSNPAPSACPLTWAIEGRRAILQFDPWFKDSIQLYNMRRAGFNSDEVEAYLQVLREADCEYPY